MENPWEGLKKNKNGEYIAACDKEKINELKTTLTGDYELKLGAMPAPYTGDPEKAVVYLLALNPGYAPGDEETTESHKNLFLKNLTHSELTCPFTPFSQELEGKGGELYWSKKLRPVIDQVGRDIVSRYVLSAEYFPYPSKRFVYSKKLNLPLESQKYTFSLIEKAIKDKKIIIVMRSEKLWFDAVPKLEGYAFMVSNNQNPIISPKNLGEDNFNKVINKLSRIKG